MRKSTIFGTLALAATLAIGAATADEISNPAIKARHAIMNLYANNLGQLGAMAKGNAAYDAEAASKAANNLALLVQLDQSTLWPQGTDSDQDPDSAALPALWQNFPDVMAKGQALSDAVAGMKAAAGTDLAALQAAMGPLGGACGGCHKAYRKPKD